MSEVITCHSHKLRYKIDSRQTFLFPKTYNLRDTPDFSSVAHFSLRLANTVNHVVFSFSYFFKPGIISNLLFDSLDDDFFGYPFILLSFFILLHYKESVRLYDFRLLDNMQYSIVGC